MNCSNFRQYWVCAGQNASNTSKINWGFTVISRFRTVVSPPFPAALCHGILGAFCSHSLAHSSVSTADGRRALHTVLLSETISPNPCLLIFALLYSHTTLFSWLVLLMLGLHRLARYGVRGCCNPESCSFLAANVHDTYFQLYFLSDLRVQLAQTPVLGLQRAVVQFSGAATSLEKAGRCRVTTALGQRSVNSVSFTAFWAAGQH